MKEDFLIRLHNILDESNILLDEPMKKHTTFKLGGKADVFLTPKTYEEVRDTIRLCIEFNIEYYVVGNGSNLIVKDGGIRGVVINLCKLNNITIEDNILVAQSGVSLIKVALLSAENKLSGLEFASGIPGSIGGAVAMNAGAYGGEMSRIVEEILLIDDKLNIVKMNNGELNYSYRNSIILKQGFIVLEVRMKLQKGEYKVIKDTIKNLTQRRSEKQPLEYPSAGSTFKRPQGHFAGKLIQDSGLTGFNIGDAEVSEKHSGFVINKGNAKTKEVLDLIKHVQQTVLEKYSINLETEVKIIGEDEK